MGEKASSQQESMRLKALFNAVRALEITGMVDLQGKLPRAIAQMLPKFTAMEDEDNPAFGFLVDSKTGRVFSLRSGLSPHITETFDGVPFQSGIMTREMADVAGGVWGQAGKPLGAHLEGQAAALMGSEAITEAVLYINGSTPCLGPRGCFANLPILLEEGSTLTVYNKNGRSFAFAGIPR